MANNLFLTATGTELGKTYISGLLLKAMREAGKNIGYFKAALSGTDENGETDLAYAVRLANSAAGGKLPPVDAVCPYIYKTAVSPHLAGKLENNPVSMDVVLKEYSALSKKCDYVLTEGSGGAVCPVIDDGSKITMLTDVVAAVFMPVRPRAVIVAGCYLGTINATLMTVEHLRGKGFGIEGVIFNRYKGGVPEDNNIEMIKRLTGLKVIDVIKEGGGLNIGAEELERLWG